MSRIPLALIAAAGLATVTSCASSGFEPIAVTRDASAVANCEKVADVDAGPDIRYEDTDAQTRLEREARGKGANTVLITDAEGRTGTAYRCAMPEVTSSGGSGQGQSR
jgi:hypothetical protein